MSSPAGPWPSRIFRTGLVHPLVITALQAATSITSTLPFKSATYSVCVAGLSAAATTNPPSLTVAAGVPQPVVTRALHPAPFTTDTVPSLPSSTLFVTYTVPVLSSTTAAVGLVPAVARATTRHPDFSVGLHVAVLITSTT
jgi:hypothetical protein